MNFCPISSVSSVTVQSLLDSVLRDVRYAFRSFVRAPLVALTIVMTVGLGLGLVTVVFTVLNTFVFRTDEVRNPEDLFAVERQQAANAERQGFTRTQYDALVAETGVFSEAFASTGAIDAWIEGRRLEGPLVTGNFFQILGVDAALGRTLSPADDRPGGPLAIVLSHRAWSLHFAADPGVLNRTVRVNGASFQIVGVTAQGFRGLAPLAAPDYWAPLSLYRYFHPGSGKPEQSATLGIVGRLKSGMSTAQALARLRVWDARQPAAQPSGERPAPVMLEPRRGTVPMSTDVMLLFMPLFFAFGLILVIGCANVANLLLARSVARQREIGVRLAVGASRSRIIRQLLTESLLLSFISAVLALGISRLVLAAVVHAITSTFPPDIGNLHLAVPPADWRVAMFLLAGATVSTVFFALAPALQATRLQLVQAIRGEVMRDGRPARARDALVALQVTGSVLLLICAAVFLRSSWAAATIDLGIRMAGNVNVTVLDERRRDAILAVMKSEPSVVSVAASWPGWIGGVPAYADGTNGKSAVTYQFVSPEYFSVFDVGLVRGRAFSEAERSSSSAVAIVSENTARQLWPGGDAVGQILRIEPDPKAPPSAGGDPQLAPRSVVVIGVAREVQGIRLAGMNLSGAAVYMPIRAEAARTTLTLRARGDAGRARYALIDRLAAIDPNMADVSSLETISRAGAYLLSIPFWVTLALGVLALVLTLSGLFSVLSYLVEQRRREIGVRMALGATTGSIGGLVLRQSARPVGLGVILGCTLTAGIGAALLATPSAELIGPVVRLFDPLAYATSVLCILAACAGASIVPAMRAAQTNPVSALRQD